MKGIILAAGRGSRMGSMTDKLPKCRTVLHGKELINWQLDGLHGAGIKDIAVVRGYLAETFDFDLTYFENIRWAETNMVMSLISAEDWLINNICITSYSDIAYSDDAVKLLKSSPHDIVMTYDPNWKKLWSVRFDDPLSDAETFILDGDRVIEIGSKPDSFEEIEGQFMGLVKFTPLGWQKVKVYLEQFNQSDLDKMDMTILLQGLIKSNIAVYAIPICDPWFEVDSENDLKVYEEKFSK
jgi:L-glutamine-phosphate cytidylyltransferase